jgi:hypothetical protein
MIITLLFVILMFMVFGKLLMFALSAAWGLTKILLHLVFWPVLLIALAFSGLIYIAIIALVVYGIIMLVKSLMA